MTNDEIDELYRLTSDRFSFAQAVAERAIAEALVSVSHAIAEERHDCEIAVWLIRIESEKDDAPDHGVSGWLKEAEDAIRMRSKIDLYQGKT